MTRTPSSFVKKADVCGRILEFARWARLAVAGGGAVRGAAPRFRAR
jgi:hypothetical protein